MAGASGRLDYSNKFILAPMVRIGTLPSRLLALNYGADIVYCEEIIDHKILNAQRVENDVIGTVDYVLSDGTLVFRTHPSEKDQLVFQLGTANAETALKAAQKVEKDVSGIDINMGCPKEFSLKGGMGAALLKQPEKVKEILTNLVKNLSIPVTCKIRILPDEDASVEFARMVESTGIAALAVHGRLTEERPRHPCRNHMIRRIAEALTIPVIANGGSKQMKSYRDIEEFRLATGASSVMVARAAEWNMSVFRKDGKHSVIDVVKDYLKIAIETDNSFTNSKYCILNTMHADMDQQKGLDTQDAKCFEEICAIWGMTDYMKEVRENYKDKKETLDKYLGIKRRKTEDGKVLIEMPVRFIKKDYDPKVSPKLRLYEWTRKNDMDKPLYHTAERHEDRCYKCVLEVDGKKFTASCWEKSKQLAEQAAAITGLIVLGLDDGKKPGSDSPNDEIARAWRDKFAQDQDEDPTFRHKPGAKGDPGSADKERGTGTVGSANIENGTGAVGSVNKMSGTGVHMSNKERDSGSDVSAAIERGSEEDGSTTVEQAGAPR